MSILFLSVTVHAATLTETYPALDQMTYKEPHSNFYLGFGLGPVGALKGRMMFTLNFFQLHYIKDVWDIEILNASYGITRGQPTYVESRHFTFRAAPKLRFFNMLSIGPVIGYEYVSFPEVSARLFKAPWAAPHEPFSSRGIIYGLMLSQTFKIWDGYIFKLNQMAYKQNYSTEKTEEGWNFLYDRRELRSDKSPIEADTIFLIEVSLLF